MDLIVRQEAIDSLAEWHDAAITNRLNNLPPVDAVLVRRGRWERDGHHIRCDKCGMSMCDKDREGDAIPRNFCPNCGALMNEDGDDND